MTHRTYKSVGCDIIPDSIITINDVVKDYDANTRAVNGVSFKLQKGEWTSIMGPSGSGKTTLLNIIGCLDHCTSGRIRISGTQITQLSEKGLTRFRRENIGFIFQQFHLVPYLSALENVMLSQYFHSITVESEAIEALERVGLKSRINHLPTQLSGGEQQRVAVARALINEPKILLADEPTGNLDTKNGKVVLELLKELNQEGNTIIMITHDRKIAEYGVRLIRLVDGRIYSDKHFT